MILPKDVKTRHKLRDAKIINDWIGGKTQEEIAKEYGFTRMAIYSILRKNREAMKIDKEFQKIERIHYLNHALANSKPSKKDRLEIIEALRKEHEGEKGGEVHNHFVIYRNPEAVKEENARS